MEKSCKVLSLCLGLLFCELCNGLPINLENTIADSHTQLLTGLVAVLLTVCSVVFLAGCLCCQRRNGFKEFRDSPVVASTASNLDHGHINPVANGEFTIFTPLSPPHQNNNVFLANQQVIIRTEEDYIYGDVDVSSWFDGTEKDFPRIKLKYIKEIGRGWFGRVVEGAAQDVEEQQKWTPVSVRILEATASSRERVNFLHDCAIYRCGEHPNILQLVGRCLDTIPLLILQEFCPGGDLKNYLRQNQVTADKLLNSEYPLQWCCQLTSALKHIHDRRLTHSDLAARNCQLTSNLTLKLGDYGLAVSHYPDDYYQGALGVPVRWCAPEVISYTNTTIEPKKITPEANIWSLGVTIWEICECGQQPYSDLTDDDVISQVLGTPNVRLNRPKVQVLYTDYLYRLMQLCWTNCESRPGVAQIDLMLADLLQVYKNTATTNEPNTVLTEDFDKRWESFKPNSIVKTDNHVLDNISTDVELEQSEIVATKPLSPSLNNLHGSLDNLVAEGASNERQMESWLENVATNTGDMSFVQGLSDAIKDLDNALALENSTSSDSSHQHSPQRSNNKNPKIEFKLGPLASSSMLLNETSPNQADSMTDSMIFIQRASSESETEEENWKTKIERGAYSEKVRQKSRSVADLMVLTHIDQSESDTETPLPSLDYKNYRNVRCGPKQNLENVSLMFGSEGNLLNVQDTFEEELKKLTEERRDSLLFVPESQHSQTSEKQLNQIENETVSKSNSATVSNNNYLEDSPSKRLLQELNSPSEIQPINQVYNVFNVTIDKFSPVHLNHQTKLSEIINLNDEQSKSSSELHEVPKLSDIIQSNSELVNYLTCHPLPFESNNQSMNSSSDGECENGEVLYDSGVEGDRMESTESLLRSNNQEEEQQLGDRATNCQNDVVTTPSDDLSNTLHSDLDEHITINIEEEQNDSEIKPTILMQVPKLVDLIQDNDDLMDYIIAKYESEVNLDKSNENFDSLDSEHGSIDDAIDKTKDFINEERTNYQDNIDGDKKLKFDLSETQDEAMPNSLTHSSVFSSTPFSKRSLPTAEIESTQDGFSLNLFDNNVEEQTNKNNPKLYSLETWDNFLGKSFDNQNESQENELFDSFTSEPHSLMYIESVKDDLDDEAESEANDKTYTKNETLIKPDNNIVDIDDINVEMEEDTKDENWDSSGGWFLHPQSNSEDISGDINVIPGTSTDSYVGFNMDDEIMAAIRNELLNKLPQAQSGSNGTVTEDEEWETTERNEVFLRYNVYNTPLSPIPEESFLEDEESSCESTPRQQSDDENEESDWSEHCEREVLGHDSPMHPEPLHRHTPSQDSCCSNDTLFNLEELTCATNDIDRESPIITTPKIVLKDESSPLHHVNEEDVLNDGALSHSINNESTMQDDKHVESIEDTPENNTIKLDATITTTVVNLNDDCETINEISENVETSKEYIEKFLASERSCVPSIVEEVSSSGEGLLPFVNKQVAPLPSPEDNPWKQLPASLLSYDKVISQNMLLPVANETNKIVDVPENDLSQNGDKVASVYVNVPQEHAHDYENVQNEECECASYENVVHIDGDDYEADYVNIVNMENSKNAADFDNNQMDDGDDEHEEDDDDIDDENDIDAQNDFLVNNEDDENDVFGVLTDIRFSGPSDNQLMTTSFSESNDLNDEQDWDSGSDTRSSSSGEFIWKEGEHEESLKALRAAPQDTLDDIKPMEEIQEETTSEESTSGSDEEGESPEFVPSAWDKFATPTKSAMRSPEKTLEKTDQEKKSKGVWFKKQKYHCVYEYPREPESPVLHSYDLWKPQQDYSSYADWDLDGAEPFVPNDTNDDFDLNFYQPKATNRNLNMYQLSSIPDFISSESAQSLNSGIVDDEFYISSSSKPFDMLNGLSSQFFPGNSSWLLEKQQQQPENATPDSGVEDVTTPAENDYQMQSRNVQSLRQLASDAVKKSKKVEDLKNSDVLGGLRHTRNKLKLDLPPSPSAFTSSKMFNIEQNLDPVVNREKPSFTTFGKSRFLVQHVDTPPDEASQSKNVSFEALPYKPIETHILKEDFDNDKNKQKVEIVRGEASLLDSADEDSGIESSTLERKLSNTTTVVE